MKKFHPNIFIILIGILLFIILLDQIRFQKISGQVEKKDDYSTDSLIQSLSTKIRNKQKLNLMKKQILKRHIQKKIAIYEPIINKFSKRYGLDWRLIVAQILKESRFAEKSVSYVGAKGLMQIMPRTAKEISRELQLSGIRQNPRANIIGGIYHLSKQLRFFREADFNNRIRFALAAYNCGAGHLFDARDICSYENNSPDEWPNVRINLTRLKKEYYPLHLEIWPSGYPKYGYFVDHKQTLNYVKDIMEYYEMLQEIF